MSIIQNQTKRAWLKILCAPRYTSSHPHNPLAAIYSITKQTNQNQGGGGGQPGAQQLRTGRYEDEINRTQNMKNGSYTIFFISTFSLLLCFTFFLSLPVSILSSLWLVLSPCPGENKHALSPTGDYFFELDERAVVPGYPKLIYDKWGIRGPIDAAFTRINCQGKTYIFKVGYHLSHHSQHCHSILHLPHHSQH